MDRRNAIDVYLYSIQCRPNKAQLFVITKTLDLPVSCILHVASNLLFIYSRNRYTYQFLQYIQWIHVYKFPILLRLYGYDLSTLES